MVADISFVQIGYTDLKQVKTLRPTAVAADQCQLHLRVLTNTAWKSEAGDRVKWSSLSWEYSGRMLKLQKMRHAASRYDVFVVGDRESTMRIRRGAEISGQGVGL